MLEFFFFILILLGGFWGGTLLYFYAKGLSNRLDGRPEGPADALLREEVESLAERLNRVEEELDFFKQLKAPDAPDATGSSKEPSS